MKRFSSKFVAIDFETANYEKESACSMGLVRVEDGQIVQKRVHLIRPPSNYFVFTYIHGLTWEDVKSSPHFGEIWPEIAPLFQNIDFVAAHNARFDQKVLSACLKKYQISPIKIPFECTVHLARKTWGIYPTKLSDVCRTLQISLNHHEALSDAMACAQIVIESEKKRLGLLFSQSS